MLLVLFPLRTSCTRLPRGPASAPLPVVSLVSLVLLASLFAPAVPARPLVRLGPRSVVSLPLQSESSQQSSQDGTHTTVNISMLVHVGGPHSSNASDNRHLPPSSQFLHNVSAATAILNHTLASPTLPSHPDASPSPRPTLGSSVPDARANASSAVVVVSSNSSSAPLAHSHRATRPTSHSLGSVPNVTPDVGFNDTLSSFSLTVDHSGSSRNLSAGVHSSDFNLSSSSNVTSLLLPHHHHASSHRAPQDARVPLPSTQPFWGVGNLSSVVALDPNASLSGSAASSHLPSLLGNMSGNAVNLSSDPSLSRTSVTWRSGNVTSDLSLFSDGTKAQSSAASLPSQLPNRNSSVWTLGHASHLPSDLHNDSSAQPRRSSNRSLSTIRSDSWTGALLSFNQTHLSAQSFNQSHLSAQSFNQTHLSAQSSNQTHLSAQSFERKGRTATVLLSGDHPTRTTDPGLPADERLGLNTSAVWSTTNVSSLLPTHVDADSHPALQQDSGRFPSNLSDSLSNTTKVVIVNNNSEAANTRPLSPIIPKEHPSSELPSGSSLVGNLSLSTSVFNSSLQPSSTPHASVSISQNTWVDSGLDKDKSDPREGLNESILLNSSALNATLTSPLLNHSSTAPIVVGSPTFPVSTSTASKSHSSSKVHTVSSFRSGNSTTPLGSAFNVSMSSNSPGVNLSLASTVYGSDTSSIVVGSPALQVTHHNGPKDAVGNRNSREALPGGRTNLTSASQASNRTSTGPAPSLASAAPKARPQVPVKTPAPAFVPSSSLFTSPSTSSKTSNNTPSNPAASEANASHPRKTSASHSSPAPFPATLPRYIVPANVIAAPPTNSSLISILFTDDLNWPWLVTNSNASSQVLVFMPALIASALDLPTDRVVTQSLQAYQPASFDSHNEAGLLALWLGYIPSQFVEALQAMIRVPQSRFYSNGDTVLKALANTVDSSFPLTSFSKKSPANQASIKGTSEDMGESAPVGRGQRIAVIASVTTCGAAILAIGLIFAARHSRKKLLSQDGSGSVSAHGSLLATSIGPPTLLASAQIASGERSGILTGFDTNSRPLSDNHNPLHDPAGWPVRYEYGQARTTSMVEEGRGTSWWAGLSSGIINSGQGGGGEANASGSFGPQRSHSGGSGRGSGESGYKPGHGQGHRRLRITRGADGLVSGIGRPVMKENSLFF